MLEVLGKLSKGYNEVTNMETKHQNMYMDIGVQVLTAGESLTLLDKEKETAVLLLTGKIAYHWEGNREVGARKSLFDEAPVVLHVAAGVEVKLEAEEDTEVLIQKTTNEGTFPSKFYKTSDVKTEIFGDAVWDNTARRMCRTVFDYDNAPYSNMVMGEIINFPGRWSSYIPHGHTQPEVYYYRFDKESGFGAAFLGDDVYKIQDNSAFIIPGGPTHPQVAAPGYAMYYCWMIRHLENNPWTTRVNDERYTWLLEENVKIWPNK